MADDIKKMEWLVATALDWRCLALTPANFLDQLLCDAWQGPLSFVQQEDAHHFARAREFALAILSSTLTGRLSLSRCLMVVVFWLLSPAPMQSV